MASSTVTARMLSRCLTDIPKRIDDTVFFRARQCLIDSIAVALAGCDHDGIRILRSTLADGHGPAQASLIGSNERVPAETAALVNGMMISVLLFDDNQMSMRGHPSAPILPVVLSLGELHDASLSQALRAFVIGYEVESWLGLWLNPSQYEVGWHATATQGTLGAAVAAAVMLDLDLEQAARALGIAASMAGGLRANFGTMTMSYHSGLAASAGVQAARLAQRGFTANEDVLGGRLTIGEALSREWKADAFAAAVDTMGEPFQILDPGPVFKLYPCGRPTLPAVDCVMELRRKYRIEPSDIADILCEVSFMYPRTLIHPRPKTGLQGKTSLEYCVASAFVDDGPRLSSFSDAAVQRPEIQDLIGRTRVEVPAELSESVPEVRRRPFDQPVTVTVTTRDGRHLSETVRDHRGMPNNPVTEEDLRWKFITCAEGRFGQQRVDEILDYVRTASASVRRLFALVNG